MKGLGYMLRRTQIDADPLIDTFGVSSHNNDRNMSRGRIRAQTPKYLISIHPRHHYIENNQVGCLSREQLLKMLAMTGYRNIESVPCQGKGDDLLYLFVIIYHNNAF